MVKYTFDLWLALYNRVKEYLEKHNIQIKKDKDEGEGEQYDYLEYIKGLREKKFKNPPTNIKYF